MNQISYNKYWKDDSPFIFNRNGTYYCSGPIFKFMSSYDSSERGKEHVQQGVLILEYT